MRRRKCILGEAHADSQVVYVIPEKSVEDMKVLDAAKNNEDYDPCKDESLTLEQVTKFITDQNNKIKEVFKSFCSAPRDTPERNDKEKELQEAKARLNELLTKEK